MDPEMWLWSRIRNGIEWETSWVVPLMQIQDRHSYGKKLPVEINIMDKSFQFQNAWRKMAIMRLTSCAQRIIAREKTPNRFVSSIMVHVYYVFYVMISHKSFRLWSSPYISLVFIQIKPVAHLIHVAYDPQMTNPNPFTHWRISILHHLNRQWTNHIFRSVWRFLLPPTFLTSVSDVVTSYPSGSGPLDQRRAS